MTPAQVHALIAENSDERGIQNWNQRFPHSSMRSHGIGLTKLRKLAKSIGRDHALSQQLWTSDVYEARVIALLIDEPKRITREQAEAQVEQLEGGQLEHVFSSCDASLGRVPFVAELAEDWIREGDAVRRRCGYGLVYELSKSKKKSAPSEDWFAGWVERIDQTRHDEDMDGKMSMATALMGIGKRTARLNTAALAVARAMGPLDWDTTGSCDPFDVVKHLDNERLRKKLGITD
jgi:3-methyladenine DNA glycosylase AlkD